MPLGPIVTDKVKNYISQVYSLHDNWTAQEVQGEVVYNFNHDPALRKRLKLPAVLPPNWPGLNAVQKVLAKIREYNKKHPSDPEDATWSIASLENHPIESLALDAVLALFSYRSHHGYRKLTIREAKWAGRLAGIFDKDRRNIFLDSPIWNPQQFSTGEEMTEENPEYDEDASNLERQLSWLSFHALTYAFWEQNYEKISGENSEFSSEDIDESMWVMPPDEPVPADIERKWHMVSSAYKKIVLGVQNEGSHTSKR